MAESMHIWTLTHPEWGSWQMEWSDNTNFEELPKEKVIGAQGFVFDDSGKFCIIKLTCKPNWQITGGKPEKQDKTFEDTLIREVNEEADLDIKDVTRVGYIISYKKENPAKKEYSLRYVARVAKIKAQTPDPAYNEIPERRFILPKDFNKYCGWGENGEFQMKKIIKALRKTF
jgi:8-oxo-dGTP pyrophosphatase MutT (NUDIX family)